MEFIIGIACVLLVLYLIKKRQNESKLPKGPMRLPLIGSIPFLTTTKGVSDWVLDGSVTQEDITTVQLGSNIAFVINDLQLAKELFDKTEFSGRSPSESLLIHRFFNRKAQGIIHTENKPWTTQRRFSLKTLKDFGFGKRSIEDSIHAEVEDLTEKWISGCKEGDVLIGTDFNVPIINVLWQLVANARFTPDNPESMKMVDMVTTIFTVGIKIDFIPLPLLKMFPTWTQYELKSSTQNNILKYLMEVAKEHKASHDPQNPRDFIDVYLDEISKDKTGDDYNMEEMVSCIFDFFVAGTETSSTTLKWILLYLTIHQNVQERCRSEIFGVLSSSRASVSDMTLLPYTQATIAEVQRLSRVAPLTIPHSRTTAPTCVGKYKIHQNATVFANLSFIMNDPKYFDEPSVFNPSRFLDSNGRFIKNERVVPFGLGKRSCMGELLARNEIFIFVVDLLQNIKFEFPEEHPVPNVENYLVNLTSIPDNFYIKITPINQ